MTPKIPLTPKTTQFSALSPPCCSTGPTRHPATPFFIKVFAPTWLVGSIGHIFMVDFKKHTNTEGTEPKYSGWSFSTYFRNIGFWSLTRPVFAQPHNLGCWRPYYIYMDLLGTWIMGFTTLVAQNSKQATSCDKCKNLCKFRTYSIYSYKVVPRSSKDIKIDGFGPMDAYRDPMSPNNL